MKICRSNFFPFFNFPGEWESKAAKIINIFVMQAILVYAVTKLF